MVGYRTYRSIVILTKMCSFQQKKPREEEEVGEPITVYRL